MYPKYSKRWSYTVASTIDCGCRKILNHGFFSFIFQAYTLPHTLICMCVSLFKFLVWIFKAVLVPPKTAGSGKGPKIGESQYLPSLPTPLASTVTPNLLSSHATFNLKVLCVAKLPDALESNVTWRVHVRFLYAYFCLLHYGQNQNLCPNIICWCISLSIISHHFANLEGTNGS